MNIQILPPPKSRATGMILFKRKKILFVEMIYISIFVATINNGKNEIGNLHYCCYFHFVRFSEYKCSLLDLKHISFEKAYLCHMDHALEHYAMCCRQRNSKNYWLLCWVQQNTIAKMKDLCFYMLERHS